MRMGGSDMYNYMGWIAVVFGVVMIAIVVLMFYQLSRTLNDTEVELERLKAALRDLERNVEETKKKLEEV